jgi:hypothetical protein
LNFLDAANTTWFELPKGTSTVQMLAGSFDTSARVSVLYRARTPRSHHDDDDRPGARARTVMTQQGTGTTPGYDAIDVRRLLQGVADGGRPEFGRVAVTQRGAGANMSVDIAASTGEGARVQGDAVTFQGLYYVPPASAVINETIAAADATNPRNDLVVLEIKDTQHDASGSNLAQTRVVTGTPT